MKRSSASLLLTCVEVLLDYGNCSSPLNFQSSHRLYTHPVQYLVLRELQSLEL